MKADEVQIGNLKRRIKVKICKDCQEQIENPTHDSECIFSRGAIKEAKLNQQLAKVVEEISKLERILNEQQGIHR